MESRCNCNRRSGNCGLSLIEVVVATAVLTIGIAVVAQAFSQCAKATSVSTETLKASLLAGNSLDEWEVREASATLSAQPPEGQIILDGVEVAYSLEREPTTALFDLQLSVAWGRLRDRRSFNLVTLLR